MNRESGVISDIILVFNTACFGDVLLCNPLCQNIKNFYPNSKIVFISDKAFSDVAKYQKDVDEVIVYDKKGEHKGFWGMFKFVKDFPYKNAKFAFLTYFNERNFFISKLLGVKKILFNKKKDKTPIAQRHCELLKLLGYKDIRQLPMVYYPEENLNMTVKELLGGNEDYIAICAVSKKETKDFPLDTTKALIEKINELGLKAVFCGAGQKSLAYAKKLEAQGCEFVDLTNKTSIPELAKILKDAKGLISVDTGTMHLGCAVGVPTAVVFYEEGMSDLWAPDSSVYNSILIEGNTEVSKIFDKALNLFNSKVS